MLLIKSLYKSYGKKAVLTNINTSFEKGKICGVIGANGAGKTTLLKCISSLESYKGKIEFDTPILKNKIGFLETNPFFISKITGQEYLQLICNARKISIVDFNEKNLFDLPLDKYAENYSTGMKKKLAITGVLLQNNEIFIFDEPFNGVDLQSNLIIKELLLKLKELDKIIIISSHIFSILTEICDTLLYLENGKLTKSANKGDFKKIENEFKNNGIRNSIAKMNLK